MQGHGTMPGDHYRSRLGRRSHKWIARRNSEQHKNKVTLKPARQNLTGPTNQSNMEPWMLGRGFHLVPINSARGRSVRGTVDTYCTENALGLSPVMKIQNPKWTIREFKLSNFEHMSVWQQKMYVTCSCQGLFSATARCLHRHQGVAHMRRRLGVDSLGFDGFDPWKSCATAAGRRSALRSAWWSGLPSWRVWVFSTCKKCKV